MTVTQRGELTDVDKDWLEEGMDQWRTADAIRNRIRKRCVEVMERSSIRAVAEATGFSTNTLQRWKREATDD